MNKKPPKGLQEFLESESWGVSVGVIITERPNHTKQSVRRLELLLHADASAQLTCPAQEGCLLFQALPVEVLSIHS